MTSHELGKVIETAAGVVLFLLPAGTLLEFIVTKGAGLALAAHGITRE